MPTSRTCVLDLEGLVPIPEGYTIVQTEAELWRAFGSDSPVWVRGPQQLVSWALRAFGGRGWSVETRSHEFQSLLAQHPGMALFVGELVKRADPTAGGSLLALGKAILPGLPLDGVGNARTLVEAYPLDINGRVLIKPKTVFGRPSSIIVQPTQRTDCRMLS